MSGDDPIRFATLGDVECWDLQGSECYDDEPMSIGVRTLQPVVGTNRLRCLAYRLDVVVETVSVEGCVDGTFVINLKEVKP